MGAIRSFRDLIVWQKSMDMAELVYELTKQFPRAEVFGLTAQMRKAVVAVPSNIAEGQQRNTSGEFRQFLGISAGSLAELETQSELARRLKYLPQQQWERLNAMAIEVGKLLNGLMRSL